MIKKELSIKQFNELVKYLKRLDDIGDDFFLKNDIICPSVRTDSNKPGKHIVRSRIPTSTDYENVLYGIAKLSETSKILGDIKGKKQYICLEQNETSIWIVVNDLRLQLAGTYGDGDPLIDELAPKYTVFDEYMGDYEWREISNEWLTRIKHGDVMTVEDENKTTYVRIARDLFKLRGVSRLSAPVDYTAHIHIISPESNESTIVIGSSMHGTLALHVNNPIIESIHYYLFTPFH